MQLVFYAVMNTYCTVIVLSLISLTGATQSEIVGGKTAKPHSRPYMASLQVKGDHKCGGFLIREDFVLTAAHCTEVLPTTVVFGAHNIRKNESSQQRIQVDKYFQHPNYTGEYEYDIMLLKLKQKAKPDKNVKPIVLPKKEKNIQANIKCSVAGWGRTEPTNHSPSSDVLKEAEEIIQFNFECKNKWQQYFNPKYMICTKFDKKSGSMCQGDSGGPLVCKNKPVGIAAFTIADNCSDREYPHVYTKISPFLSWIENVMKKHGNVA